MGEVVLKYSAGVYQAKIQKFESLNSQLNSQLELLDNLRNRVPNFWEEEKTAGYLEAIAHAINRVRSASNDVAELSRVYQETVEEQTRLSSAIDESVQNAKDAQQHTVDLTFKAAETVGKILPLL